MRRLLLATMVLLLSLLLSVCVLASGCNEEKPSAEDLLIKAGGNFMEADSYRTRLDATMEISGDASDYDPDLDAALPLNLGFGSQIDLDISDRDSIRIRVHDISVDGLTDMIRKTGEASGDSNMSDIMAAGMISQMFSGMELMQIKDTIYLQVSGAWFDLKLSDLSEAADVDLSKADLNCLVVSTLESEDTWSSEGGLTDFQELDEEEIDGVKTRHISVALDPEVAMNQPDNTTEIQKKCGFGDLMDSVRDDAYDENSSAGDDAAAGDTGDDPASGDPEDDQTAEEKEEDEAQEKAITEAIARSFRIDFWIDADNNLRQQSIVMEMNFGDISRLAGDEEEAEQMKSIIMKMSMIMKFSGYGEAMEITTPENTTPLKGLLDEMGGSSLGGIGPSRTEQV